MGKYYSGLSRTIVYLHTFVMLALRKMVAETEPRDVGGKGAVAVFSELNRMFRDRFFSPDSADFGLVCIGLVLISVSYVMSFALSCIS